MASPTPPNPRRWRRAVAAAATTVIAATVVALAVVWPGFDAQQTPLEDASVWALQTGDGRRYAKVNTQLHELETVKRVENPSGIAQTAGRLFVYADGDTKFADVSLSRPADLAADDADAFQATPAGTTEVAASGDYVAYLTETGSVYAARLSGGGAAVAVDPAAGRQVAEGEERPTLRAAAVAVTANGIVYAVSLADQRVISARASTGEILSDDRIDAPDSAAVQLSVLGDRWAVFDADQGLLWTREREEATAVDTQPGAVLQQPGPDSDTVLIADAAGLMRVARDGSASERIVTAAGVPAAPVTVDGVAFAAWLGPATGTLWSSQAGTSALDYGAGALDDEISPLFAVNGSRAILNETASGWVWTIPDGRLVTSSQRWDSDDAAPQRQEEQLESERVIDPKPPVAVADAFGVRAGRDVVLPVLLNDHDPNEDVLSILPDSIGGLDPGFGTVRTTNQDQQLVVAVAPGATGSATFGYRITDGTTAEGLNSEPATVTLTVVPDGVNNAPVWCGVEGCLATWPAPQVAPGGTVSVDVLDAWVDPDGDPVYLAGAVNETGLGSVAADPAGSLTYQHPDPNATDALGVQLALTVSDSRGATAEKDLTVSVTPSPQLSADSFAVTGAAGTPVTVDLASHVHGATGSVSLTSAKPLTESGGTVTPNAAALSFVLDSARPGSHLIQYTVRDGSGEVSASVRVTLVDPATAQITTTPLTAFVRPNEDASVDVLAAVGNPAGLVLLVSDLRPEPTPTATLSVDTVGQNLIRVSGSTDDGRPGTLGTVRYTVSDGSGGAGATTTGELTVILLPAATAEPPIAIDDAVTVRAGSQIDIPVLENDTAPAGALIAVDPAAIVNESEAGLAFATPRLVRYLAPTAAGTYSIGYTVYRVGFPEMTDTARIFVTVLPADANSAPVPHDLVGRVLSGASVSIAFDGFGVDPDGDDVTLDRVVSQPAQGSASIAATGDAVVYTSAPGASGQDAFVYQVRDSFGATGTATVRIGILDAQSDPSPVTYSDYAQAQAGEASAVVVHPADNDIDPAGGALELVRVAPNAQAGSAEHDALEAMLAEVDTASGAVRLNAGTELGTYSFVYTVRNRTGDTAQGLIVLKVVRAPVPDYPVVADTALTVETREDLPSGVDVVSGKVSWSGGDVSSLTLSLWGDAAGLSVSGWRISGAVPSRTRIVPFQLSGTSFAGADVVSYGFLRIPGDDDIKLTLRPSAAQAEVNEKSSVDIDMSRAVAVPAGATLQIDPDAVAASGARPNARCSFAGGTTVRYEAGAGAPWTDVCTVPVKLATQRDYTYLAVRIAVIAEAPQPALRAASVSVSPGSQSAYDLAGMTTWQGQNDWGVLQYAVAYAGDQFTVVQSGTQLTITAKDTARPGREEPVVVRLTSHPDASAATLTVTVGPAPSALPKGGTAAQQCSQSGGTTSCTITVIGVGGEVNPLPGTPLTLVSVTGSSNCQGVTFAKAGDTAVTASWASGAPGAGDCTGSFVVQDAQLRQSSGDRDGTVILDLQGLPADPTRVNWTNYSADTVTLSVVSETSSYPAVSGYRVTGSNGSQVMCDAAGRCPAIASSPAENGQGVAYHATAINPVGESRGTASITAYSYRRPAAPKSVSAVPTGDGTATITVAVDDPSTGSVRLKVRGTTSAPVPVSGGSAVFADYDVGSNTSAVRVEAIPSTRYSVPPDTVVAGGSSEGDTATGFASGVGAPVLSLVLEPSREGSSGSVTATATVTANAIDAALWLGFSLDGAECTPADTGAKDATTASKTYSGLPLWQQAAVTACAVYRVGTTAFAPASQSKTVTPVGTITPPSGPGTYRIGAEPTVSADGLTLTWRAVVEPVWTSPGSFTVTYFSGATRTTDFASLFALGVPPEAITARSCDTNAATDFGCSAEVAVEPADGSAAYTAQLTLPGQCSSDEDAPAAVRKPASADLTVAPTTTTDADGVKTVAYAVSFAGGLAGLTSPYTADSPYSITCSAPAPAPDDGTGADPDADPGSADRPAREDPR